MKTMHGFILNWHEDEPNRWTARSVVSFNTERTPTNFAVRELPNCEGWLAEMDDSDLDSHDTCVDAMAACEAKFVEWAMPAIYRPDCENHEAVMKVMKRLGRGQMVNQESEVES